MSLQGFKCGDPPLRNQHQLREMAWFQHDPSMPLVFTHPEPISSSPVP
jgi:hypothetical protein